MLLSCEWLGDKKHLVTTSLEGEVNILAFDGVSIKTEATKEIDNEITRRSNIVFCSTKMPSTDAHFFIGSEN